MHPSRNRLTLLLAALALLLAAGLYLRSRFPAPAVIFEFKIPAHSRMSLLWEQEDTEQVKRIELKANPGDQLRIAIEPGDPGIPALDALPRDFFFEAPADAGSEPPVVEDSLLSRLRILEFENQPIGRSRFQFFWESYDHPLLAELRRREKLDDLLAGSTTEFEQFTRLLDWTHRQWPPGQPDPYPPWNALEILDWIRSGRTQGFCAQYAQVMVQSLLAFGHQARYVSLANHEVLEAWSNEHGKWVALDPNDGVYYTDGKSPLNCYELYLALMEGRTNGIQTVGGPVNPDRFKSYGVFIVSTRNDHLSQGRTASDYLRDMWKERIHLVTPYTKGFPYQEGKIRPVTPFVSDLYFPLNSAHVRLLRPRAAGEVEIWLETVTPGFASFLAARDGGDFEPIEPKHIWRLRPGRNEIRLVASNRRGVRGPDSRIVVEQEAK